MTDQTFDNFNPVLWKPAAAISIHRIGPGVGADVGWPALTYAARPVMLENRGIGKLSQPLQRLRSDVRSSGVPRESDKGNFANYDWTGSRYAMPRT